MSGRSGRSGRSRRDRKYDVPVSSGKASILDCIYLLIDLD
jgi:hypothetical protein